jgi:ribosomal subunit interface protein
MSLRISGKNLDIGDAFRTNVESRIGEILGKYFEGGFGGHVTLEREGGAFRTECALHLDSGADIQAEGRGKDAYVAFDQAAERIEKRLRRYKRRLKEHHHDKNAPPEPAAAYVLAAPGDDDDMAADDAPVIIAEETTQLRTMTVSGAVMAMDLADQPMVVFRHAGHGGINVVYRRSDGHIGWIDPALKSKGPAGDR